MIRALILAAASVFAASAVPVSPATEKTHEAILRLLNSRASGSRASFAAAADIVKAEARAGGDLQRFVLALVSRDPDIPEKVRLSDRRRQDYLDGARAKIRALAEKKGDALAWYLLSIDANDNALLEKSADLGCVQAMNAFGTATVTEALEKLENDASSSNACEKAIQASFRYFTAAALEKDANGYFNLGTCYLNGWGCRTDKLRAFECFAAASREGHPAAMEVLSICYVNGDGTAQDAMKSLVWKMRAKAARGDEPAIKWLKANGYDKDTDAR